MKLLLMQRTLPLSLLLGAGSGGTETTIAGTAAGGTTTAAGGTTTAAAGGTPAIAAAHRLPTTGAAAAGDLVQQCSAAPASHAASRNGECSAPLLLAAGLVKETEQAGAITGRYDKYVILKSEAVCPGGREQRGDDFSG